MGAVGIGTQGRGLRGCRMGRMLASYPGIRCDGRGCSTPLRRATLRIAGVVCNAKSRACADPAHPRIWIREGGEIVEKFHGTAHQRKPGKVRALLGSGFFRPLDARSGSCREGKALHQDESGQSRALREPGEMGVGKRMDGLGTHDSSRAGFRSIGMKRRDGSRAFHRSEKTVRKSSGTPRGSG